MSNYKNQVSLLLQVLPEVAKETSFALHGGTAINLFIRDMPRLSVDIDLTNTPIEDRNASLKNIINALNGTTSDFIIVSGSFALPSITGSQSLVGTSGATWYVTGVQLEETLRLLKERNGINWMKEIKYV